jgi:hypothetical protein
MSYRPKQSALMAMMLGATLGHFPDFGPTYQGPVSDPTPPVNPKDPEAAQLAAEAKRRRKEEKRIRDAERAAAGKLKP